VVTRTCARRTTGMHMRRATRVTGAFPPDTGLPVTSGVRAVSGLETHNGDLRVR
jgi:hypothetical protein